HAGRDLREVALAEVREHVPRATVDQRHDLTALVRVLADGDVQVRDVALEGRAHEAVVDVELRVVDGGARRLQPGVHVAVLAEQVPRLRDLRARARDRRLRRTRPRARL